MERKKEEVKIRPTKLSEHQKAEVIFLEKLSLAEKREKLAFQYPLLSISYSPRKPRIIVPDISEFQEEWKPDDYSDLADLEKLEYPKRILKLNTTAFIIIHRVLIHT